MYSSQYRYTLPRTRTLLPYTLNLIQYRWLGPRVEATACKCRMQTLLSITRPVVRRYTQTMGAAEVQSLCWEAWVSAVARSTVVIGGSPRASVRRDEGAGTGGSRVHVKGRVGSVRVRLWFRVDAPVVGEAGALEPEADRS